MSDIRARRTAALAAAAKAKSEAKAHAADQAIRRLVRRGEPVTFQAVQREALLTEQGREFQQFSG